MVFYLPWSKKRLRLIRHFYPRAHLEQLQPTRLVQISFLPKTRFVRVLNRRHTPFWQKKRETIRQSNWPNIKNMTDVILMVTSCCANIFIFFFIGQHLLIYQYLFDFILICIFRLNIHCIIYFLTQSDIYQAHKIKFSKIYERESKYHTRTVISPGLYDFYPIFNWSL